MTNVETENVPAATRGPAYPFSPLRKAVERVEQVRDANMVRSAVSPIAFYKAWGFAGENGNSRQVMAALNHFGLVDYIGRGKEREVKLSPLALRIVLDKIPDSKERAVAIKEAALIPEIYRTLWEKYGKEVPPGYAIETFLVRDREYSDLAAKNVIEGYLDTFEYAKLGERDVGPETEVEQTQITPPILGAKIPTQIDGAVSLGPIGPNSGSGIIPNTSFVMMDSLPDTTMENDIKVLLDGDRLRVSAYVDIKGAKRLVKALKANMALLEDDEDDV
jgi:hypothetical protein